MSSKTLELPTSKEAWLSNDRLLLEEVANTRSNKRRFAFQTFTETPTTFDNGSILNANWSAYGSFRDTTTQQIDSVNTPKAMTFNQITPGINGVSASGVSVEFGSHIVVARTGTYNIQFSAQLTKTDSGNDIMEIWLRRNGNDVPLSNSEITITASLRQVASSNYIIDLAAGDYVQLMYSSADIATRILAIAPQTNPVRPAGPSISVAITQVQ